MLARQLVEPVQWERTLVALTQEEKKASGCSGKLMHA